jgi:hypothetical protein
VPAVPGAQPDQSPVAANSKRVPTLFWMNASGKRAASAWVARQPGAMRGHEVVGGKLAERVAGRPDNRFERPPAEVEASQDGVDPVLACELSHVVQDVDDAGVSAAGQDDETVSAQHRHEGLIVEDQRVGLPPTMPVGLVPRKAAFEFRGPVDFAGD